MSEEQKLLCPICGKLNEAGMDECTVCGSILTQMNKDDLTILNALKQISGVGKSRAKKIVRSGIDDIEKLEEADIESFLSVEGIGKSTAEDIISTLEQSKKQDGSIYLCGECGAFVSADSNTCPNCGMIMEENETEEETSDLTTAEESLPEDEGALYLCSNCGSFISGESDECIYCGYVLDKDDEIDEREHPVVDESEDGLFLCTNCGSFVSSAAEKCSSCGFFFDEELEEEVAEQPDIEELEEEVTEIPEVDEQLGLDEYPGLIEDKLEIDSFTEDEDDMMWYDEEEIYVDESDLEELDREIEMALEKEYGISAKTIQALSLGSNIKMCGNCGGITEKEVNTCSVCGYSFSEDEVIVEKEDKWDVGESSEALTKAFGLSSVPADEKSMKDEGDKELDLCGVCGAFKTQDSERCPICGSLTSEAPQVHLEDIPEEKKLEDDKSKMLFICDACGSFVDKNQERCSLCGSNLEYARRSLAEEKLKAEDTSQDHSKILDELFSRREEGAELHERAEIATCGNCGALISSKSSECYICSVSVDEAEPAEDLSIESEPVRPLEDLASSEEDLEEAVKEQETEYLDMEEDILEDLSESELEEISKELEIVEGERGAEITDLESEITDEGLIELLKDVEKVTLEDTPDISSSDAQEFEKYPIEDYDSETEDDFDADSILKEIGQDVKDKVDEQSSVGEDEEWEKCPSCNAFISVESHECGVCGYTQYTDTVDPSITEEDTTWLEGLLEEDTGEERVMEDRDSITQPGGLFNNFVSRVSEFEVPLSSLSLFAFGGVYLYSYGSEGGVSISLGIALLVTLGIFLGLGVITILNWKEVIFDNPAYKLYGYIFGLALASIVPINHYILRIGLPTVVYAGLISVSLGIIWILDSQMSDEVRQYMMWFTGITMLFIVSALAVHYRALSLNEMGYPTVMSLGFGSLLVIGSTVTWYKTAYSEEDVYRNIEVGHRHLISGDYEDALVAYERAIQKGSKSAESLQKSETDIEYPIYSKGLALCSMGEYEEAVDTFKKVLEVTPNSLSTWNNLGTAYSRMGKQDIAIKCLRRALEIDSDYEVSWNNLGNALFRKEQYSKALDCYDRALGLNKSYRDATVNKTQCLIKLGSGR